MAKITRVVPQTKADAEKMSQGPEVKAKPTVAGELIFLDDGVIGSDQQDAIWSAMTRGNDHLVVNAYAGTGKTFTMVRGLSLMHLSGSLPRYTNVAAFNRSVGKELQTKVPEGVRAGTLHAYGFSACRYVNKDLKVDEDKMDVLLTEIMGENLSKEKREIYYNVLKLSGLCKNTLTGEVIEEAGRFFWEANDLELDTLCDRFDLFVDNKVVVYDQLRELMTVGVEEQDIIDQDDMIWFPVVLDYKLFRVDLLIVDEAQDLNACQQALILRAGKRIMIVGDRYQAIYGFRGADAHSITNTIAMLERTGREVKQLSLSKTRRCPKSHVAYVKETCPWLSEFEALPDAPEGVIESKPYENLEKELAAGDMVVCRTNAPIIRLAFACIRRRFRVKIQGREIGADFRKTFERLGKGNDSISNLKDALEVWGGQIIAKLGKTKSLNKRARLLTQFQDKLSALRFFVNNGESVRDVLNTISELFSETDGKRDYALLGTAHALKGMEADTVWVLGPEQMPHPMAKTKDEIEQEWNLWYVAHTRSKNRLCLTSLPQAESVGRYFEEQ